MDDFTWGGRAGITILEFQKEECRKRMPFPTKYKEVRMLDHSGARDGTGSMAVVVGDDGTPHIALYHNGEWHLEGGAK